MSFKETVLPDFVLAGLYPASLIGKRPASGGIVSNGGGEGIPVPQSRTLKGQQTPGPDTGVNQTYKYLGKNQRKVSVIARYSADPYIPEEHLQFLVKILSACKLNLGDVAILNDATATVEIGKLKAELAPAFVLLFDVEPVNIGLPLSFPLLRPQSFDGTHYLTVPPIASLLEESENAKGLKKQLWDSLKKMFGV